MRRLAFDALLFQTSASCQESLFEDGKHYKNVLFAATWSPCLATPRGKSQDHAHTEHREQPPFELHIAFAMHTRTLDFAKVVEKGNLRPCSLSRKGTRCKPRAVLPDRRTATPDVASVWAAQCGKSWATMYSRRDSATFLDNP